jgi:hypothetical protein
LILHFGYWNFMLCSQRNRASITPRRFPLANPS